LSPLHRLGELSGMSRCCHPSSVAWLAALSWFICSAEPAIEPARAALAGEVIDIDALAARARRAGLRTLTGRRLVLVTDRPHRDDDGVDRLPVVFDQAFDTWCQHYGIDPDSLPDWRAFGCLVVDRERFRAAGLLPAEIPEFSNGFCDRNRFWLVDQSNPDYRRHLLLHEGVHAFTLTVRDLATPTWYTEGIAEHLATHRLEADARRGIRFVPTAVPERATDVEQLGRIERIRRLRLDREAPALEEVFATPPGDHRDLAAYASSWAAVTLLAGHPVHAAAFARLERGGLGPDFTARLTGHAGWDPHRVERDFDAFTQEVDYGYDLPRMAIDWSAGSPLEGPVSFTVDPSRGWQNSGVRLRAGERVVVSATGRYRIDSVASTPPGRAILIESGGDGISLRWYRGRPIGRLLVAQWNDTPADGDRPRFEILAAGASGSFPAITDGPLYCRINESPGALADNAGALSVTVSPQR
jgi:hypothetical protein